MKTRFLIIIGFLVLFASAVTIVNTNLVYAEPYNSTIKLTIELDKEKYKTGETISVVGDVGSTDSESLATITLLRPDGNIVTTISMMPVDGIVSYNFTAGIGNMDVSGLYTIKIEYESINTSNHGNQTEYVPQSVLKQFSFNVVEEAIQMKTVGDDAPFFWNLCAYR